MRKNTSVPRLVESGLLLALTLVLGLIKLVELPYGGSITAGSAIPLLLLSYRHGVKWGLFAGLALALVKLVLGAGNLSYCPTLAAAVAMILLDYLLAYSALGLGGAFRRRLSQTPALILGALLSGGVRYLFHVIAGCTVWAGLSIPTRQALMYSLAYNATYMLPETIVTVLAAGYLSRALDLRSTRPARHTGEGKPLPTVSLVLWAIGAVAGIADLVLIFSHLQNAETGEFDLTGLTAVPPEWGIGLAVIGIVAWTVGSVVARRPSH